MANGKRRKFWCHRCRIDIPWQHAKEHQADDWAKRLQQESTKESK
jgi:hypothetical protein